MTKSTQKAIYLIIAVAFLTYANSLMNEFYGDDNILIVNNTFYCSLKNIAKIFSSDFIMQYTDIDAASSVGKNSFSGFVAYRPVTALTFFTDALLWKDDPMGYHLTNIVLHALVSVLIFIFVGSIAGGENLALLTALLFAAHPINAEAVNSIGFRSDLLAALFFLLTFIAFIRQHNCTGTVKKIWTGLSYISFALGLFSKESAAPMLGLLILYDICFLSNGKWWECLKRKRAQYAVFLSLLLFYLYMYWVVFPNSNSSTFFMPQFNVLAHLKLVGKIFINYIIVLVFPPAVTVLPPLYAPAISSIRTIDLVLAVLSVLAFLMIAFRSFTRGKKDLAFWAFWFLLTYLPVSDILLLPNPFSYRFMYLPAIGFCALLAIAIEKCGLYFNRWAVSLDYRKVIKIALLCLYVAVTVPLNMFYRNGYVNCREMIRNYPDCRKPYLNLGMIYLENEKYELAIESFEKYLKTDPNNPFVSLMVQDYFAYHLLGRCYIKDPDKAIFYFKTSINLRPDYVGPYLDLSQVYLSQKKYGRALDNALRAIALNENLPFGYAFAVYSYHKLGEQQKAKELLEKALSLFPKDPAFQNLAKDIEEIP